MFGGSKGKEESKSSGTIAGKINQFDKNLKITGDISGEGVLRLDGIVEGNIDLKGKVIIGSTGHITGTLKCQDADVSGKVIGTIDASNNVTIKNKGYVEGEVIYESLAIDLGGNLNGKSSKKQSTVSKAPTSVKTPNTK